jgi:23S rRNA pseudouridine1911/1915/1917 synthase
VLLETKEYLWMEQSSLPPTDSQKGHRTKQPWVHDIYLVAVLVTVFILDQITKELVRNRIAFGGSIPSDGYFRLTHTFNTGSAFGFFTDQTAFLTIASFAGIAVLIIFYRHQTLPGMWLRTSLGLQLGGAAGNLADRITLGGVTDFIDIGRWPVFNLADASIVLGISSLAWLLLSTPKRPTAIEPTKQQNIPSSTLEFSSDPSVNHTTNQCISLTYEKFPFETPPDRLDNYLVKTQPHLTRSQAQRLIKEGKVSLNGSVAKASLRLRSGDQIQLISPPPTSYKPSAEEIPVNLLFIDINLVVVDKAPGLTVHPAPGHPTGTLVNALLARFPELADVGDILRPGIVHRLDADTSGVMVVARSNLGFEVLSKQIREHTINKVYLALVIGNPTPTEGLIKAPLGRDPHNRKRMAIVEDGRQATTHYKVLENFKGFSLLEIAPQTGRTHQIRVHLSSVGHPIAGDKIYGGTVPFLQRQFLHSHKLGFHMPINDEYVEFISDLTDDLKEALPGLK